MKTYHYLLIIAAVLGVVYVIARKKNTQKTLKNDDKKTNYNNDTPTDDDTISEKEAIAITEEREVFVENDNIKPVMIYIDDDDNEVTKTITQETYNTLVDRKLVTTL